MAAVGTRELQKYINEQGQKLWAIKLVIPTETSGVSKQSQNIGVNGLLQSIAINSPNLVTDTTFQLFLVDKDGADIGRINAISDNDPQGCIGAQDLMIAGERDSGNGVNVFSDDYIEIKITTAQAGGSLDFEVILRGI